MSQLLTAEPSDITKPSLLLSNGRDASDGESLYFVDKALIRANPAILIRPTLASVPTHTMRSASPYRMKRKASPMAWTPVVHAVDTE